MNTVFMRWLLLAALPSGTAKPLQMVQIAATHLVFDHSKRAHVTLLLIDPRWLPMATQIILRPLMLAYRVPSGSAPIFLNSVIQDYAPSQAQHSSREGIAFPARICLIELISY